MFNSYVKLPQSRTFTKKERKTHRKAKTIRKPKGKWEQKYEHHGKPIGKGDWPGLVNWLTWPWFKSLLLSGKLTISTGLCSSATFVDQRVAIHPNRVPDFSNLHLSTDSHMVTVISWCPTHFMGFRPCLPGVKKRDVSKSGPPAFRRFDCVYGLLTL